MMTPMPQMRRRGVSLVEVMVAFFVLAIGVVSVVTLFPVGIAHVQQAVLDTKTAILGQNAEATVKMHQWWDDPYLLRPPIQGVQGAATAPFNQPDPLPAASGGLGGDPRGVAAGNGFVGTQPASAYVGGAISIPFNNVYATIINADGQAAPSPSIARFPPGTDPSNADFTGFPVYVDPVLANAPDFQSDLGTGATATRYKRVAINADLTVGGTTFRTMAPFTGALNDLMILSPSSVQYQPSAPATATQPIFPSRRDAYLRQFIYSTDETMFEDLNSTIPYQPNRILSGSTPTFGAAWRYSQSANVTAGTQEPPGSEEATASRNDNYHYSFAFKNRLIHQNTNSPVPAMVPTSAPPDMQVLVFNRRTTNQGYVLLRACFYANSSVVTLSWDPTVMTQAPTIRRGSWLMEATLSPAFKDKTYGPAGSGDPAAGPAPTRSAQPGFTKYRHAVEFHQVSSIQDPQIDQASGQMVQVVTLEQPVANYPISHFLGDARALPDAYQANTFDGTPRSILVNDPGPTTVWVPVVVWHGLQEVFSPGK